MAIANAPTSAAPRVLLVFNAPLLRFCARNSHCCWLNRPLPLPCDPAASSPLTKTSFLPARQRPRCPHCYTSPNNPSFSSFTHSLTPSQPPCAQSNRLGAPNDMRTNRHVPCQAPFLCQPVLGRCLRQVLPCPPPLDYINNSCCIFISVSAGASACGEVGQGTSLIIHHWRSQLARPFLAF